MSDEDGGILWSGLENMCTFGVDEKYEGMTYKMKYGCWFAI